MAKKSVTKTLDTIGIPPNATAETIEPSPIEPSLMTADKAEGADKPALPPLRVLTLDGGPASYLALLMLGELEAMLPGFLERVDLIAGTSAGAISGLMLATKENPAYMLPVASNFWLNVQLYYKNSLWGYLEALVGMGAINDPNYVKEFLEQPGVLGEKRLKDLAKRVVITSFDVNPATMGAFNKGPLNWKAKIFHTFGCDDDGERRAVDVALSSSASPIATPIHHGKVDGGLVANNPAMIALTQVVKELLHPEDKPAFHDREGVVMLSVGSGRAQEVLPVFNNSWGYGQWLLNPSNPLLLLNAFLAASTDAVAVEAKNMLKETNFFRLDPFYTDPGVLPFMQADPKKQQMTAQSQATQLMIQQAKAWIVQSGWMN